jgi:hypothetical protein
VGLLASHGVWLPMQVALLTPHMLRSQPASHTIIGARFLRIIGAAECHPAGLLLGNTRPKQQLHTVHYAKNGLSPRRPERGF